MWPTENIESMYMPIFLDSAQLSNIIYQAYIVSHTACAVMLWRYLQGMWCLHFARLNSMFVRQDTKIILAMQCFLSMTLVIVEKYVQTNNKETQKLHITGPLWRKSTGSQWFHSQRASNAENASMSRRLHGYSTGSMVCIHDCCFVNFYYPFDISLLNFIAIDKHFSNVAWCHAIDKYLKSCTKFNQKMEHCWWGVGLYDTKEN